MKRSFLTLLLLSSFCLLHHPETIAQDKSMADHANVWQSPDKDILKILHAPPITENINLSIKNTHAADRSYYLPNFVRVGGTNAQTGRDSC